MTSIFERTLGADFARLHPQLRRRFGVSVTGGRACVGTGTMDHIWHAAFTRPFLALGTWRNILVPEKGRRVPFTIENYPYVDSHGRETVTFVRTFDLPRRRRRFDATMVYDHERRGIVDYLGSHQHLAVDLDMEVDEHGGLVIRSGEFRLHEGLVSCRLPDSMTGTAVVRESYDDDAGLFRVGVTVSNAKLGPLFGYWGTFRARYVDVVEHGVPATVKPRREEARR
ncbi:DUF4166 domain-containing protein [Microbispora amethystogenes]|uniref:DUF4166 domain-containing protein n=1 Tax=Microbispora amethystogenes TaxID=1427754 RepID=A0ABQ4FJ06_9ACTN|nr:DUF4166 domain-containing protein [Microbispora amethystogenes]GIH34811.1 hypothetical protein Mam01_49750 [Microbispora amethystogenes]